MWWLTLRLQRAELILLLLCAIAIPIPFLMTADQGRLELEGIRSDFTAQTCPGDWITYPTGDAGCSWAPSYPYQVAQSWSAAFAGLPVVIAMLLVIPVIMELQSRNYRVAWTQSLRRDRWVTTHIALIVGVGLLFTGATIVLMRWWPNGREYRWGLSGFDLPGVVNVGWYILAVGLVLAVATALRRPLIAVALAVIGYGALRIAWIEGVRPRLLSPEVVRADRFDPVPDGAWILASSYLDNAGRAISDARLREMCPFGLARNQAESEAASRAYTTCIDANTSGVETRFLPRSDYWPLQFAETGIVAAIGLALIGWTVWYWLRRLE